TAGAGSSSWTRRGRSSSAGRRRRRARNGRDGAVQARPPPTGLARHAMKKTRLQRAIRAYFRLPEWLRPALLGAGLVALIFLWRAVKALPELLAGRGTLRGLVLALGAAAGAGFVGGLVHGLSRPRLRKLGRAGDYLSGVVILYGYLGALMLASPYVF